MIYPTKTPPSSLFAYVKNGVVYDLSNTYREDSCRVEINETNSPKFTVTTNEGDSTQKVETFYLYDLIENGDTYDSEHNTFYKTIHSGDESVSAYTFNEYFHDSCEDEIKRTLISRYGSRYDYFTEKLSRLGVPTYMLSISGDSKYELSGVLSISFNEDDYNGLRKQAVAENIVQTAMECANKYGFTLGQIVNKSVGNNPSALYIQVTNDKMSLEKQQDEPLQQA